MQECRHGVKIDSKAPLAVHSLYNRTISVIKSSQSMGHSWKENNCSGHIICKKYLRSTPILSLLGFTVVGDLYRYQRNGVGVQHLYVINLS